MGVFVYYFLNILCSYDANTISLQVMLYLFQHIIFLLFRKIGEHCKKLFKALLKWKLW